MVVLFFQISSIYIFYYFKGVNLKEVLNKYIGIGDILVLVALAPMFQVVNYIKFVLVATLFSLFYFILSSLKENNNNIIIPYAGIICGSYTLIIIAHILGVNCMRI